MHDGRQCKILEKGEQIYCVYFALMEGSVQLLIIIYPLLKNQRTCNRNV